MTHILTFPRNRFSQIHLNVIKSHFKIEGDMNTSIQFPVPINKKGEKASPTIAEYYISVILSKFFDTFYR